MKTFRKPQFLRCKHPLILVVQHAVQPFRAASQWGEQTWKDRDKGSALFKRHGVCFIPKPIKRWHLWVMWGTLLLSILLHPILIDAAPNVDKKFTMSQPQVHPIPATLSQWHSRTEQSDYFNQVKASPAGYLIWSRFPIQVYVTPLPQGVLLGQEKWQAAIASAVQAWSPYLPLKFTNQESQADIRIQGTPPKQRSGDRVRSAETRYEFYVSEQQTLAHRIIIYIRPNQTEAYIKAAIRHELGHALGIWGHSPSAQDTMYFSQVRNPAEISDRDINTLKQIYRQPTQLGWPVINRN